MTLPADVALERMARPLLELIQLMTGLETAFVTEIDWVGQTQEVVLARNGGELEVAEGSVVDWSDSMCRWAFLSGKEATADVVTDFPGSLGGEKLHMRTFVAVPILIGDATVGTVCGASRREVEVGPDRVAGLRLIAEAMAIQVAAHVESKAYRERAERAEVLAMVDPLTGLANRRAFTARFEEELARAGRQRSPLAVILLDIDHSKRVNDSFGHHGGDTVLKAVADSLRAVARTEDVPARIGGDEFALLLPDADGAGAQQVADRVAKEFGVATSALCTPCTLSLGISTNEKSSPRDLLATADRALYRSKANGRNRVEVV